MSCCFFSGIEDDKVKVITVDSATGEIVPSLLDHSPTSDSVDGSVPSDLIGPDIKALDSLQAALDNFPSVTTNSDGSAFVSEGFAPSVVHVSSVADNIVTIPESSSLNSSILNRKTENSGGAAVVPQVLTVESKSIHQDVRVIGKRPASSGAQNNIINKVLITKNPSSSEPQAVPIQIQTVPVPQGSSGSLRTPTKTITISQQGILSPVKGITMAQVAGTPPKLPISKLPISPAKTPTKITMIPVSLAGRSPQKIAPAGLGQTLLNNNSSNVQTTITMSPSKVVKQPGTVQLVSLA